MELEKARILRKAAESCMKRAQLANELIGLNVLLLDEPFMREGINKIASEKLAFARLAIKDAITAIDTSIK